MNDRELLQLTVNACEPSTMAMDLIRHIAGLYSGKAIKGDFTQIYITGNEIWMAQQVLASQIEDAQREMEAREKQEPLSLQFVNAVKQLCKDFSDRQDRPYMGDVYSALDALLVNEGIPVAPPKTETWRGDLPHWDPCNLACDDDLNGVRNRYCDCEQARSAMAGLCLDKSGVSANCPQCSGAGEIDSGGTHPWGEPALNPCGCRSETENTRDKS